MNSEKKTFPYLLVVILITFVAFFPSLQNGFTNWDDDVYVTQNPVIQSPENFGIKYFFTKAQASNYHPITMLSLAMDYKIWGSNAFGYHLSNLLFHLFNTALVFLFIYQLADKRVWVALIAGLLFGIHPLHVESVAWISERKDVLYVFFFLLGLLSYLRFRKRDNDYKWYIVTFICFVLSLFSKPAAVIFPMILFSIDWYQQRKFTIPNILLKAPFFFLSVLFGIVTVNIQKEEAISMGFSLVQKICFAGYGFVMYLVKLIVPFGLSPLYPYPVQNASESLPGFYYLMPVIAISILIGFLILGRKHRYFIFGILFFLINIVLVLQIVAVGNAVMADRYAYLSSVGIFFIIGMLIDQFIQKEKLKTIAIGGFALYAAILFFLCFQQTSIWKDGISLWSKAIAVDKNNMLAYNKRGLAYMNDPKKAQKALGDFNKCIELEPNYDQGWGNRGYLYFKANQFDKAESDFGKAIELNPGYFKHYNNRGHLYYKMQNFEAALKDYNKCIELNDGYALAFNNRAIIYHQQGEKEKALADYNRALEINPNYGSAQKNRALLLQE